MKSLLILLVLSLISQIKSEGDLYQQIQQILQINDQTELKCDEISEKLLTLKNALTYISSIDIEDTERILSSLPKLEILINELKDKRENVKENEYIESFEKQALSDSRDLQLEEIKDSENKYDSKIKDLSDNAMQSFDALIQQMKNSFQSVKKSQDQWLESQGIQPSNPDDMIVLAQKNAKAKKHSKKQNQSQTNYEPLQNEYQILQNNTNQQQQQYGSEYQQNMNGEQQQEHGYQSQEEYSTTYQPNNQENSNEYYFNETIGENQQEEIQNQQNFTEYKKGIKKDEYSHASNSDEYSHSSTESEQDENYHQQQFFKGNESNDAINHNQYNKNNNKSDDYSHASTEQKDEEYQIQQNQNQTIEVNHYGDWQKQQENNKEYSHASTSKTNNQNKAAIRTKQPENSKFQTQQNQNQTIEVNHYGDWQKQQENKEQYSHASTINSTEQQQYNGENIPIEKSEASIRTKNSPRNKNQQNFTEGYNNNSIENKEISDVSSQSTANPPQDKVIVSNEQPQQKQDETSEQKNNNIQNQQQLENYTNQQQPNHYNEKVRVNDQQPQQKQVETSQQRNNNIQNANQQQPNHNNEKVIINDQQNQQQLQNNTNQQQSNQIANDNQEEQQIIPKSDKVLKYFQGTHVDPQKQNNNNTSTVNIQHKFNQIQKKKNQMVVTVLDVFSSIPENKESKSKVNSKPSPHIKTLLNKRNKKSQSKQVQNSRYTANDPFIQQLSEKFLELKDFMSKKKEIFNLKSQLIDKQAELNKKKTVQCQIEFNQ